MADSKKADKANEAPSAEDQAKNAEAVADLKAEAASGEAKGPSTAVDDDKLAAAAGASPVDPDDFATAKTFDAKAKVPAEDKDPLIRQARADGTIQSGVTGI